jgi:hypothetical protein
MALSRPSGWADELGRWLLPFLAALSRPEQRRWAPPYLRGLLLPGERKSVEPMAARVAPGEVQQLHHFVSASPWATGPVEAELVRAADRLVGGPDAALVVDDTALVKQGSHSVGVQRQYCGQLGKRANCQALVSLTLARGEVPVCIGLRLFLPELWASEPERRRRAGVPDAVAGRPKWRIALDEIDRVLATGARFDSIPVGVLVVATSSPSHTRALGTLLQRDSSLRPLCRNRLHRSRQPELHGPPPVQDRLHDIGRE